MPVLSSVGKRLIGSKRLSNLQSPALGCCLEHGETRVPKFPSTLCYRFAAHGPGGVQGSAIFGRSTATPGSESINQAQP